MYHLIHNQVFRCCISLDSMQDTAINDGLNMKKGRPCKEIPMKKDNLQIELAPSEREELIRLRAETEYLRAENEAIKKSIALRQEKEAVRLKAKKQQSLRNSEKRDTN